MKMLSYPGLISKSHLITIGCAHSWPFLVAALDWLADEVNLAFGPADEPFDPMLTMLPTIDNNGERDAAGSYAQAPLRDFPCDFAKMRCPW